MKLFVATFCALKNLKYTESQKRKNLNYLKENPSRSEEFRVFLCTRLPS